MLGGALGNPPSPSLYKTICGQVLSAMSPELIAGLSAVQPASGLASDDVNPDAHAKTKSQGETPGFADCLAPRDLSWKEPICYLRLTMRQLFGPKAKEASRSRKPSHSK